MANFPAQRADNIAVTQNPYVGLRSFESQEAEIFFGRDKHIAKVLERLAASAARSAVELGNQKSVRRFVAIIGTSGSGKSSLVKAGVIPELRGGSLAGATSRWRVCVFRPEDKPVHNLSKALWKEFNPEPSANADLQMKMLEATCRRNVFGVIEAIKEAPLSKRESLLLVVDQFEELVRLKQRNEPEAFVKRLLAACEDPDLPVYVMITMRSEYLGECARFEELPEAINDGLYLIPRLTRTELTQAIEYPLVERAGSISPGLVQRLLNDLSDDPDQLPVLQHALMRSWNGPECIDPTRYEQIGGTKDALSNHANDVIEKLRKQNPQSEKTVELLFKCLTEPGADQKGVRSPMKLGQICRSTRRSKDEITEVITAFRKPGRAFLMPPHDEPLEDETPIDISHESLIRKWNHLRDWVKQEAESAEVYRDLCRKAEAYARDKEGLLGEKPLPYIMEVKKNGRWNSDWAERYGGNYRESISYLRKSSKWHRQQRLEAVQAEEAKRKKQIDDEAVERRRQFEMEESRRRLKFQEEEAKRKQWLTMMILGGLALIAVVLISYVDLVHQKEIKAETAAMGRLGEESRKQENPIADRVPEALAAFRLSKLVDDKNFVDQQRLDHWELFGALTRPDWCNSSPCNFSIVSAAGGNHTASADVSPDGRYLAAVVGTREEDEIRLWKIVNQTQTPKEGDKGSLLSMVPRFSVNMLKFSPDGAYLASLDNSGALTLFSTATGTSKRLEDKIEKLAFSNKSTIIALTRFPSKENIDIIDADGSMRAGRPVPVRLPGAGKSIFSAFNQDGSLLALVTEGSQFTAIDSVGPGSVEVLDSPIASIAFGSSQDGFLVAIGTQDRRVGLYRIRRTPDGLELNPLQSRIKLDGPISALAFNADGRFVAVGTHVTSKVEIYELTRPSDNELPSANDPPVSQLIHNGDVNSIVFSRDSTKVLTASSDNKARIFETLSGRETLRVSHEAPVFMAEFMPNSERVFSAGVNSTLALTSAATKGSWQPERQWPDASWTPMKKNCFLGSSALSPDGTLWAMSCKDAPIAVEKHPGNDRQSAHKISLRVRDLDPAKLMAFSLDGQHLAISHSHASGSAAYIHLSHLDPAGEWTAYCEFVPPRDLEKPIPVVQSLAVSANGSMVAVGTDAVVYVVNENCLKRSEFTAAPGGALSMAFDKNGKLAIGSGDGTVRVYSYENRDLRSEPKSLPGYHHERDSPVTAMAFSTGGKLVSADQNGLAIITTDWNGKSEPQKLNTRTPASLASFSQSGDRVALANGSRVVLLVMDQDGKFKLSTSFEDPPRVQALSFGKTKDELITSVPMPYSISAITHKLDLQSFVTGICAAQFADPKSDPALVQFSSLFYDKICP